MTVRMIAAFLLIGAQASAPAQVPASAPPQIPADAPVQTPPLASSRVLTVDYAEDRAIPIQGTPGYQVAIEFGGDERIENVSVGDSAAWQVTANKRGDHLFVKPIQSGVSTNMVVVTDRRLYAFDLSPLAGSPADMAYAIRFRYPLPAGAGPPAMGPAAGRYRLHGTSALRPDAISDDGVHTYIQWPANATLPAIYALDGDGKEILTNGAMRDGIYVVDSVASRLIFRRDRSIAYAERQRPEPR